MGKKKKVVEEEVVSQEVTQETVQEETVNVSPAKPVLKIKLLTSTSKMPEQAHEGDMYDLFSNENVMINSFESKLIHLGIAFNIPKGYRVKIFGRSSLPLKKKIIVSNNVGIIDQNYVNEVCLICHSLPNKSENGSILMNNPVQVNVGDKIAQFQLEKIEDVQLEQIEELDTSNDRGGGFGSTGTN